jgi:hypothetical protein
VLPHTRDDAPALLDGRGRFQATLNRPVAEPMRYDECMRRTGVRIILPMRHHLEATVADGLDDLAALLDVCNLELLLEEDRGLLIGRLDDPGDEDMVRRRRRRVQQREEVDRLWSDQHVVIRQEREQRTS